VEKLVFDRKLFMESNLCSFAAKRRKRRSAARRNQNRAEGTSRAEAQRRRERPRRNATPGFLCVSAPLREKIFAGMRDSDGLQCKKSIDAVRGS
jgi:hypothetical protein